MASTNLAMTLRLMSQRSMIAPSRITLQRGGHGHVDSWIQQGQGKLGSVPMNVGPHNKVGTAVRVFGLWFALPIGISLFAFALAQSKA